MIKVLIVDDDNMVRKGLISILPWREYGMEVVGEAKNGEKALEFLASNKVDLLFTDLAMPVMSGMELMGIVRKQYPHIFIVVLTLHQDFEYIQECLRLGAIDYIAKVEMENENFGEVMGRIQNRIAEEQSKGAAPFVIHELGSHRITRGYALTRRREADLADSLSIEAIQVELPPFEWDTDLFLWLPKDREEEAFVESQLMKFASKHGNWIVLKIGELEGFNKREIHHFIRQYKELGLWYEVHPGKVQYEVNIGQTLDTASANEHRIAEIKNDGLSLGWVHKAAAFDQFLEDIREQYLTPAKLISLLHAWWISWNRIYYSVTEKQIVLPDMFHAWFEVEEWLSSVRVLLVEATGKSPYSEEVKDCITKAVQTMHDELSGSVHASEMAKRVNMSRSYFSQCFKDVVGMTFNDYLRHIRVEKAKEYLQYTHRTIQWIAENTGYNDQKYFSRVFLEKTGVLPSEYRQSIQSEVQMSDS